MTRQAAEPFVPGIPGEGPAACMGRPGPGPCIQFQDELTGRQILVYLANLAEGQPLTFTYHLRARFPLSVRSPASSAYDYYNPAVSGEKAPQLIEVKQ